MSDEIQFILSGKSPVKHGTIIQTIISYLEAGQGTSEMVERDKHFKKEETKRLKDYIFTNLVIPQEIRNNKNLLRTFVTPHSAIHILFF